jgi:RNA-directed DNA polymerase
MPLGLDKCQLPYWPHTGALATWLGLSDAGMWRLTRAAAWQRRSALGDQHYGHTMLAKPSGGWRLLEVPHPYLMPLQRRLLDDLLDRIPPHEAACGYVRGRSVVEHARAHVAQAVVLKFDLQDFFTSVRASRVHALFTTLGYAETVARELTALCTTATPEAVLQRMREEGGLSWTQAQGLRSAHLPQGAPTSRGAGPICLPFVSICGSTAWLTCWAPATRAMPTTSCFRADRIWHRPALASKHGLAPSRSKKASDSTTERRAV